MRCALRAELILVKTCDVLLCGGFAYEVRSKNLKHMSIIYKIEDIEIADRNYFFKKLNF